MSYTFKKNGTKKFNTKKKRLKYGYNAYIDPSENYSYIISEFNSLSRKKFCFGRNINENILSFTLQYKSFNRIERNFAAALYYIVKYHLGNFR